jgi:hypothetical protein
LECHYHKEGWVADNLFLTELFKFKQNCLIFTFLAPVGVALVASSFHKPVFIVPEMIWSTHRSFAQFNLTKSITLLMASVNIPVSTTNKNG